MKLIIEIPDEKLQHEIDAKLGAMIAEVTRAKVEAIAHQIIEKQLKFYVINAFKVARESGMGGRINTIMQVCFFALSGVLPRDEAIAHIKDSIKKSYGKKGEEIVQMNM
jgi:pyruvate-ferredoxin/flavodoxin oxidoreductase